MKIPNIALSNLRIRKIFKCMIQLSIEFNELHKLRGHGVQRNILIPNLFNNNVVAGRMGKKEEKDEDEEEEV